MIIKEKQQNSNLTYFLYFILTLLIILLIYFLNKNKKKTLKSENEFAEEKILNLDESENYYTAKLDEKPPFKIDLVFTWAGEKKSRDIRTNYNGELQYSLRAAVENLPWINKIYILMNEKKIPSWFKNNYSKLITLIGHEEVFDAKNLPNINSNAIEMSISNIEGLSEHFIYFNDDIFVSRKLPYTEFFTRSGKAINIEKVLNTVQLESEILKFKLPKVVNGFHLHIPIVFLKSEIINFENKYPEYVNWVRSTKIRKFEGGDICRKNKISSVPCQQLQGAVLPLQLENGKSVIKESAISEKCGWNGSSFYVNSNCMKKLKYLYNLKKKGKKLPKSFAVQESFPNPNNAKIIKKYLPLIFDKKPFYEK